eukprot:2486020-Pleurochrysis_carterae.AAC.2
MFVAFTRKGARGKLGAGGRKAVGLFKWSKYLLNQRRNDPNLAGLDLHAAERKLLLKWNSVSECIFDAIPESAAATVSESGPATASASGASSLVPSDKPTHHSDGLGRALGKPAEESREKPPGAGSCT